MMRIILLLCLLHLINANNNDVGVSEYDQWKNKVTKMIYYDDDSSSSYYDDSSSSSSSYWTKGKHNNNNKNNKYHDDSNTFDDFVMKDDDGKNSKNNHNNNNKNSMMWSGGMHHNNNKYVDDSDTKIFKAIIKDPTKKLLNGIFAIKVRKNSGLSDYFVNLKIGKLDGLSLPTGCGDIVTKGVGYKIHAFWKQTAGLFQCLLPDVGGVYDPYFACSDSSENNPGPCPLLGRTSAMGYNYQCEPMRYAGGDINSCEVGDLSDKFGNAMPVLVSGGGAIISNEIFSDPLAVVADNYENANIEETFQSIVFSCPDSGEPLFCAEFVPDN